MVSLIDWVESTISNISSPIVQAVVVAIMFVLIRDFYTGFVSALLTWFKK